MATNQVDDSVPANFSGLGAKNVRHSPLNDNVLFHVNCSRSINATLTSGSEIRE